MAPKPLLAKLGSMFHRRPPAPSSAPPPAPAELVVEFEGQDLGFTVAAQGGGYLVVLEVSPGGKAEAQRVVPGDVVWTLEGQPVRCGVDMFVAEVAARPRPLRLTFRHCPPAFGAHADDARGGGATAPASTRPSNPVLAAAINRRSEWDDMLREKRRRRMRDAAAAGGGASADGSGGAGRHGGGDTTSQATTRTAAAARPVNPATALAVAAALAKERAATDSSGFNLFKPVTTEAAAAQAAAARRTQAAAAGAGAYATSDGTGADTGNAVGRHEAAGSAGNGGSGGSTGGRSFMTVNTSGAAAAAPAAARTAGNGEGATGGIGGGSSSHSGRRLGSGDGRGADTSRLAVRADEQLAALEVAEALDIALAQIISSPAGAARTALDALTAIVSGMTDAKNTDENRLLRTTDVAFASLIAAVPGGVEVMLAAGFRRTPDGSHLWYPEPWDPPSLGLRVALARVTSVRKHM